MINKETVAKTVQLVFCNDSKIQLDSISSCMVLVKSNRECVVNSLINGIKSRGFQDVEDYNPVFDYILFLIDNSYLNNSQVEPIFVSVLGLFNDTQSTGELYGTRAINILLSLTKSFPSEVYSFLSRIFSTITHMSLFVLSFYLKCLSQRDKEITPFLGEQLETLVGSFIKDESKDNYSLYFDIFLSAFSNIGSQSTIPEAIGTAFIHSLSPNIISCCTSKAFKFLSIASSVIPYSVISENLDKLISSFSQYLIDNSISHLASVSLSSILFRFEKLQSYDRGAVYSLCDPLLKYIEKSYEEYCSQTNPDAFRGFPEALRSMQIMRAAAPTDTLNLIVLSLQSANPSPSLAVVNHLITCTTFTSQEGSRIVNEMSNLLQKKLSSDSKSQILQLWCHLCEHGIDIGKTTQQIFRLASSPSCVSFLPEFERSLMSISSKINVSGLLDAALDPYSLGSSKIAFELIRASKPAFLAEQPLDGVLAKALYYSFCSYFSPKSRSDILYSLGKLMDNQEILDTSNRILAKNCPTCTQRYAYSISLILASSTATSETWISFVNQVYNTISTEMHPDSPNKPIINEKAVLQFKVAQFLFLSCVCAVAHFQTNASQRISALFKRFEIKSIEEIQPLSIALKKISEWNNQLASEYFKGKADIGKKNKGDIHKKMFILDYSSRFDTIEPLVIDLLFDDEIPPLIASHAQRRILKSNSPNDVSRHLNLINKLLSIPKMSIGKAAIESLYLIIQSGKIVFDKTIVSTVKKVLSLLKIQGALETLKPRIVAILDVTPPEFSFESLCSFAFSEEAELSQFCVQQLEILVGKCTKPNIVRTPYVAASVSLFLSHAQYQECGSLLSQKIFLTNKQANDFALQVFLSSQKEDVEAFIPHMFSFLSISSPWQNYASTIILRLAQDMRFRHVLELSFSSFDSSISVTRDSIMFSDLAKCLFALDRHKFVTILLDKSDPTTKPMINLLSKDFETYGTTILDIGTRVPVSNESSLHSSILSILVCSKIPDALRMSSFSYITLIFSQSELYHDLCINAYKNLESFLPGLKEENTQGVFRRSKGVLPTIHDLQTLFASVAKDLTMYHLAPFVKLAPKGAIAGYGEIVFQGRPMLLDILTMSKTDPNSVLIVIPRLTQLAPERYGEKAILDLIDFIVGQMEKDDESFNCLQQIFSWIPSSVISQKSYLLFNGTQKALMKSNPSKELFTCIALYADSLVFSSQKEFKQSIPSLTVLSFSYCDGTNIEMIKSARQALVKLLSFSGYPRSAEYSRHNIQSESILPGLTSILVKEMDVSYLDSALIALDVDCITTKINLSILIAACVREKKGIEKNPHLRLVSLLISQSEELKCGVLNSIKMFPPML